MSDQKILIPYRRDRAGRRVRPFSLLFLVVYCAATGAFLPLLPPQLLVLLAIPLFIAVPVIFWLLPDGGAVPEKLLGTLLISYIAANVLWPSYLAIDLPGLPWINPPRIVIVILLTLGVFSYSTSSAVRRQIADVLNAMPPIKWFCIIFWTMTLITIALARDPAFSLSKWVNNQIFWTFLFLLAAWLGTRDGTMSRLAKVITWVAFSISLESMWEFHLKQVPWTDHIPSFLKVDDNYLVTVLKVQSRAGTDIYRAHATFANSLIFAEFLAMSYPFLIHATLEAKSWVQRLLLIAGMLATLVAMWLSNSRSAMIGFFLSVFLYGGFAAYRHWRRHRQSLVGVSVLAMLPLAAGVFLALSLTWPRLHNITFGGGQQQPSTEARKTQWTMGTPMFKKNPIGHGPGSAATTLGFTSPGGQLTIDTYYLSLVLEYGVVGFAAFLAMFGGQAIYGMRIYLAAPPGEENLAGPISIALLNFLVIKAVLSSEFNMPIAFTFLGFMFALAWRQQQRTAPAAGQVEPALPRGAYALSGRPA